MPGVRAGLAMDAGDRGRISGVQLPRQAPISSLEAHA